MRGIARSRPVFGHDDELHVRAIRQGEARPVCRVIAAVRHVWPCLFGLITAMAGRLVSKNGVASCALFDSVPI